MSSSKDSPDSPQSTKDNINGVSSSAQDFKRDGSDILSGSVVLELDYYHFSQLVQPVFDRDNDTSLDAKKQFYEFVDSATDAENDSGPMRRMPSSTQFGMQCTEAIVIGGGEWRIFIYCDDVKLHVYAVCKVREDPQCFHANMVLDVGAEFEDDMDDIVEDRVKVHNKLISGSSDFIYKICDYKIDGYTGILINPDDGWTDIGAISFFLFIETEQPFEMHDGGIKTDGVLVDGQLISVNKHLLAMHSPYFERFFFATQFVENQEGNFKIKLDLPATVADFQFLIKLLTEHVKLDDNHLEPVLHLARRFLMNKIICMGRKFLVEESKKPAICKYRLAVEYGFDLFRVEILKKITKKEFNNGANFLENLEEFNKLDEDAAKALRTRHSQLFDDEAPETKRSRRSAN